MDLLAEPTGLDGRSKSTGSSGSKKEKKAMRNFHRETPEVFRAWKKKGKKDKNKVRPSPPPTTTISPSLDEDLFSMSKTIGPEKFVSEMDSDGVFRVKINPSHEGEYEIISSLTPFFF